jgi:hypothetical protein
VARSNDDAGEPGAAHGLGVSSVPPCSLSARRSLRWRREGGSLGRSEGEPASRGEASMGRDRG